MREQEDSQSGADSEEKETYDRFYKTAWHPMCFKTLEDKFVAACEADGRFEVVLADANNGSQKQVEQVDNFLVMDVDALVLSGMIRKALCLRLSEPTNQEYRYLHFQRRRSGGDQVYVGVSNYDCGYCQENGCVKTFPKMQKSSILPEIWDIRFPLTGKWSERDGLGDQSCREWRGC